MRVLKALKSVVKSRKIVKKPTNERLQKHESTQLSKSDLEAMLANSYQPNSENGPVNNYSLDPTLSDDRVKTYYDPVTNHTVIAHRGSAEKQDWIENAMYSVGIKGGKNYKHSREMQKKIESKYGSDNLTTIGHSKGALHAQEFGQKGDIVTLNKPVNVRDALNYKVPKYQTDYRGEGDVVSALRPFQGGKKEIVLKDGSKSRGAKLKKKILHPINSILKEHATETLSRSS
jgi:hypothetical protein